MAKLDHDIAKANGILARASEDRQAAAVIAEAHVYAHCRFQRRQGH